MMYENSRAGILDEFTDKLSDEAQNQTLQSETSRKLQAHFIRGLVCDLVDRVSEDADRFKNPNNYADEEIS